MMRFSLWTGLAMGVALGMAAPTDRPHERREAVLVELFTSEGCSSCPPADALLERLDRGQPIPGAQIVVLSEHVDYWNHIGWADPYSSHAFSARQEQYARRFRTQGPYTPQMVVDGQSEFVGSDARAAESAIRSAAKHQKAEIRITEDRGSAIIDVAPLPSGTARKASVFAAYAIDSGTQDVVRGENRGRRLHHVAIAKEFRQIGTVDDRTEFKTKLPVESGARLIVFVQEFGSGPVWGTVMRPASH
ncbi:MAG TPA: DUF1223 domain-containing protein [Candidatus Solibacter sp.]|nr:DUF1223 domain-containing protein [Candidatus Solibacter sp.]